ncbi:MAG: murein L,D-transpeptidase catalytic domain family protein [Chitinophagales bacterium]|nr:murein L,D-transpeptidase catalytic domain family protein [Chitinophagales bacterium]
MKKIYWTPLVILIAFVFYCFLPTEPAHNFQQLIQTEISKHKIEFEDVKYAILIDYNKAVYKKRLWIIEISTGK